MVLYDDLAIYKLAREAHCSILYRGYLVASLSLFYIAIILLYEMFQREI
jgi:hypothetical protein